MRRVLSQWTRNFIHSPLGSVRGCVNFLVFIVRSMRETNAQINQNAFLPSTVQQSWNRLLGVLHNNIRYTYTRTWLRYTCAACALHCTQLQIHNSSTDYCTPMGTSESPLSHFYPFRFWYFSFSFSTRPLLLRFTSFENGETCARSSLFYYFYCNTIFL